MNRLTDQQHPAVFTPNNEPYLGRPLLLAFDNSIIACLAENSRAALESHKNSLSSLQQAGLVLIPQSISLALSLRELLRQGYLFAAKVLTRPLLERVATMEYLLSVEGALAIWERGWKYNERPGLKKMLYHVIGEDAIAASKGKGPHPVELQNSVIHGDPDSAKWNLIKVAPEEYGQGVSKILDNPDLCDEICWDGIFMLRITRRHMKAVFPPNPG